jgi:hypothetical protein
METETGTTAHLEVSEMSVDEDQVRKDWEAAVGLNELKDDPDALTITELATVFGFASRDRAAKWAEHGVEAGTVEKVEVYRDTGNGHRWQRAYKLKSSIDT